jgi:regulator of replication initiation timing
MFKFVVDKIDPDLEIAEIKNKALSTSLLQFEEEFRKRLWQISELQDIIENLLNVQEKNQEEISCWRKTAKEKEVEIDNWEKSEELFSRTCEDTIGKLQNKIKRLKKQLECFGRENHKLKNELAGLKKELQEKIEVEDGKKE